MEYTGLGQAKPTQVLCNIDIEEEVTAISEPKNSSNSTSSDAGTSGSAAKVDVQSVRDRKRLAWMQDYEVTELANPTTYFVLLSD